MMGVFAIGLLVLIAVIALMAIVIVIFITVSDSIMKAFSRSDWLRGNFKAIPPTSDQRKPNG
jgi:hypothetical protein